jgi:rubrerythrin
MAVQNEERAFAFWSYMAASAKTPDIKSASEAMAREELGHVATLRRERRRAYHRERSHASCQTGMQRAGSAESRVNARILKLQLAAYLDGLTHRSSGAVGSRLRELREETLLMAEESAAIVNLRAELAELDAQAIAEALADAYLMEAENASDEERVDLLQRLAMKAIARLAWLRSMAD